MAMDPLGCLTIELVPNLFGGDLAVCLSQVCIIFNKHVIKTIIKHARGVTTMSTRLLVVGLLHVVRDIEFDEIRNSDMALLEGARNKNNM